MKKTVYLIIVFFLFQGIFHNLGHPITPAFVRGLSIPDYMFGVFFAAMSLGLMIGGPLWGVLSDQTTKKKWIVIGLFMYSIGQFGFGYAHHQVWMVVFRFFAGFGAVSVITLFTSQIIESSEPQDRAKHLAYAAAATTLGASFGYYIGGFIGTNQTAMALLGTSDLSRVFLFQAILNALYALTIWVVYKEVPKHVQRQDKPSLIKGLKEITKIDLSVLIFLISLTFMTIGAINLSKYIDVYFDELGYSPQQLGTYVMVTGIVSLFASIVLVPFFSKVKKQLLFIGFSHILAALIVVFVFRSSQFLIMMYSVYLVYVIIKTIYQPLEQSFIAKQVKTGQYGGIMGLRQSFVSFGMVMGPLIGGFIYDKNPIRLFDFSASSFLVGVLLLGVVYHIQKKEKNKAYISL